MPVYKLKIEYDGTGFSGWQKQPGRRTVEGSIIDALSTILRRPAELQGASRTDAGVHALGQVASFSSEEELDRQRILKGINALCRPDISVSRIDVADEGFNARFDSAGKRYRYRILNRPAPSPFLHNRSWHVHQPLDIEAMEEAASHLVGTHDFAGFRAADCGREDTIRTITKVSFVCGEDGLLDFFVEGTAFLKYMVRIMAGTLVDVGLKKLPPQAVEEVLVSKDRGDAGRTAPPKGLTLLEVFY